METGILAAMLGIASAISWGGGDFCGGVASRRAPLLWVLTVGAFGGLVLLVGLAFLTFEPLPSAADFVWGFIAGLFGTLGLGMLYRGLSIGRAALVAPLSAVISAALPVVVGALTDGLPSWLQLLGFALALVGIWLVAQVGHVEGSLAGVNLAVLAGLGFGAFFVLIDRASETSTFWPLVAARLATFLLAFGVLAARRQFERPARRMLWLALLTGVLDVGGNLLFVLASQLGRLDVAAVLASLYPASTVILSFLLLGERMSYQQLGGLAAVFAAIVLIVA